MNEQERKSELGPGRPAGLRCLPLSKQIRRAMNCNFYYLESSQQKPFSRHELAQSVSVFYGTHRTEEQQQAGAAFDLVVTKKTAMMNSIIGDARSILGGDGNCCYPHCAKKIFE